MAKMSNGVILRIPPSCAPRGGGVPLDARAAWGGCHSLCYLRGWRTCGVRSIPPAWLDGVLGSTVARPASEDFVQRGGTQRTVLIVSLRGSQRSG